MRLLIIEDTPAEVEAAAEFAKTLGLNVVIITSDDDVTPALLEGTPDNVAVIITGSFRAFKALGSWNGKNVLMPFDYILSDLNLPYSKGNAAIKEEGLFLALLATKNLKGLKGLAIVSSAGHHEGPSFMGVPIGSDAKVTDFLQYHHVINEVQVLLIYVMNQGTTKPWAKAFEALRLSCDQG